MKFLYTVNPESDEPIMLLNKQIGSDEDGIGIQGDLFQAELLALDQMNPRRIQVYINSVGGVVVDGYSIYNAILKSKTPVDTYCCGIAASIAGVIFQAGRKRIMADYGILMYHNPSGGEDKSLDAIRESLVTMVSSKSGKTKDEISAMMDKTTYITADEAYNMGLCDEVELSIDFNKKHWTQLVNKDLKSGWLEANKILNKVLDLNKNTMSLKKLTNKLKLNEDASEDSIIAAFESIENKAAEEVSKKDAEIVTLKADIEAKNKSVTDLQKEMEKCKDAYEKCKAEYEKCKNDMEEEDKKAKASAAEALKVKAKEMVTSFAKLGRIKNDEPTIAKWTEKAIVDMDGTKELIEGLPLNKKAEKITEAVSDKDSNKVYNAVYQMTTIAAKHNQK